MEKLLSDEEAFKKVFGTHKFSMPKKPESVPSPKEYIGKIIEKVDTQIGGLFK